MKIILTGMMGVGKTAIGEKISKKMNLPFLDLDKHIEKKRGLTVSQIFSQLGEAHYRKMEKEACKEIARRDDVVIATGGKTLLDKKNLSLLSSSGLIITLLCSPQKILQRIQDEKGQRPILASHPEESLHRVFNEREQRYLRLPNKIDTTSLKPDEVVEEIGKILNGEETRFDMSVDGKKSSVFIKTGITDDLGNHLKTFYQGKKVFVLSDEKVFSLHGLKLIKGLNQVGYEGKVFFLPSGESQKNSSSLRKIYDWLQKEHATRHSLFVSFGGGVISDIGGFVSSTFHRGMRLVNIPTTLLAQVDASIGGKNAINLNHVKNQIGTFYFPEVVLINPLFLVTLSRQQIIEGLIEALKAGIIADKELFFLIKDNIPEIILKDIRILRQVIVRAVKVKSMIVRQDPYEKCRRRTLNLGHTFGHAIESYYGNRRLSHGQAVALGMISAAKLGTLLNSKSVNILPELKIVLEEMTTPTHLKNADKAKILSLMQFDKKKKEGKIAFVVPKKIGEVVVVKEVNKDNILESLKEICHE